MAVRDIKAVDDPTRAFSSPREVVESELPREEKIKILKSWELDARRLLGVDHPHGLAGLVLAKTERRHDLPDAVKQLALHGGCGGRQTGIKCVETKMFAGH